MDTINSRLRRFTPPQILAVGVVALLAAMGIILLAGALIVPFLVPIGEPLSIVLSLAFYVGGGWFIGHHIGATFGRAYYDRKFDDELLKVTMAYQESREQHG